MKLTLKYRFTLTNKTFRQINPLQESYLVKAFTFTKFLAQMRDVVFGTFYTVLLLKFTPRNVEFLTHFDKNFVKARFH